MTITTPTEARTLISSDLRALLIKDVRKDWPELSADLGQRGVDQLLAFLATSAQTNEPLTPSLRVDLFWHALIQRTVPYLAISRTLGVDFIHHVPTDDDGGSDPAAGRAAMATTTAAIERAGFEIDPDFWPNHGAADCTQCQAGCTDSPKK